MKNLITLTLLLLTTQAHSKSLLDYILNPKRLIPDAQSCSLESDELTTQCVESLCKGLSPDMYPMILMEDKFESFIISHPNKASEEELKRAEAYVDWQIKSINNGLDKIIAKTNDEIIKETTLEDKENFVAEYLMNECIVTFNLEKPVAQRVEMDCKEPQLQSHPVKKSVQQSYAAKLKDDLENSFYMGFYSEKEVAQLIPARESALKEFYNQFKATAQAADQQAQQLIAFMDKNWGQYSSLSYADRMRYLKGIGELSERQNPSFENSIYSGMCRTSECEDFFAELVKTRELRKKLSGVKEKINKPEFKKVAMASINVNETLKANAPSEKDIEAFDQQKEKVIEKILAYQKKLMSEHSFGVYKEKLKEATISLDKKFFENNSPEVTADEVVWENGTLLGMILRDDSSLYSQVGANLGSPIALTSDHYIDPKYKDFYDQDFNKVNVNYSLFSIKEKEHGTQILAHELGHHFSHLHDAGEFSPHTAEYVGKVKSCIKSRYDKFKSKTGKDGGSHYLEEEFADEFGFTTIDENTKMLFCPVLITPYQPNHLSLELMETGDPHPRDLWRSLNQLKASGKEIPLSCKELMLKNSESYEYKRCL